jgi:hypothetical protein
MTITESDVTMPEGTAAPEGAVLGPGPATEEEVTFRRKPMVGWFDPSQLMRTAARVLLSEVFGEYADKRELQAALSKPDVHRYTDDDEMWIDFIADLGDGFDSTYTLAWLLARKELELPLGAGERFQTRRGRVLVMGGDEVYPTASREEYNDRMAGPYEAALPCEPVGPVPDLFAIPGNHDWYDGLTSFIRQFCQGRWIGGWRTRQSRSYFALQLPQGWWLWGTDLALCADIDAPQLAYFLKVAREEAKPGDRVILCTPNPSWVVAGTHDPSAFDNLEFFERAVITKHHLSLAATLTGDMHHYARYEREGGGEHKFTAGGGGAYLINTHHLPETITLGYRKERDGTRYIPERDPVEFTRKATYPEVEESRRLARGAVGFGRLNVKFATMLGGMYALIGALLLVRPHPAMTSTLLQLAALPVAIAFALLFGAGLYGLSRMSPGAKPGDSGQAAIGHWILHLVAIGVTAYGLHRLLLHVPLPEGSLARLFFTILSLLLVIGVLGAVGYFVGSAIFGGFLVRADARGINTNEVFAAQRIEDYKNFLRLHIDAQGDLTVYPVKVPKINRKWRFVPAAAVGQSFYEPAESAPQAELIESPIVIRRPVPNRDEEKGG